MERNLHKVAKISLLIPLGIFAGAIFLDINILSGVLSADAVKVMREWFIIIALALSIPLVYKQKWASDRNVLRGLRFIFFLVLFTYIALLSSKANFIRMNGNFEDIESIYSNTSVYLFAMAWAFFLSIFVLLSLGTLRNLVFIKRKKSTARNFAFLMIFLFAYALLNSGFFIAIGLNIKENAQYINYFLSFILINLMVINSFRVSWINYLNKKQKLACFWGGIILLPIQAHLSYVLQKFNVTILFSPALGEFVNYSILFLTVYLVFAFLALIAHLPTAKLYDKKMNQISSLHRLSRAVSSEFDLDKLVLTIVKLATDVTEADFTWLELTDPQNGSLKLVSTQYMTERERHSWNQNFSEPLVKWLKENTGPFYSNEVTKSDLAGRIKKWKKDLDSLIAVPMITNGELAGVVYVGRKEEFGFEQDDIDTLRAFSEQAAVAIENARLVQESIIKERLEQELKIAHDAQQKLLPKTMPEIPGFKIEAICKTANEVGGDYYDVFKLDDDRWGVVVGDVSGKGASAAFYMAEMKGIVEALSCQNRTAKETLVSANKLFYDNVDRRNFITVVYGIIDVKNKRFSFCRAGHCPVLLVNSKQNQVEMLQPKGIGIGLDPGMIFENSLEEAEINLEPGSSILLYTDGAIDARNGNGEQYGEERLGDAFLEYNQKKMENIKEHLITSIMNFVESENIFDDMTFVIIQKCES